MGAELLDLPKRVSSNLWWQRHSFIITAGGTGGIIRLFLFKGRAHNFSWPPVTLSDFRQLFRLHWNYSRTPSVAFSSRKTFRGGHRPIFLSHTDSCRFPFVALQETNEFVFYINSAVCAFYWTSSQGAQILILKWIQSIQKITYFLIQTTLLKTMYGVPFEGNTNICFPLSRLGPRMPMYISSLAVFAARRAKLISSTLVHNIVSPIKRQQVIACTNWTLGRLGPFLCQIENGALINQPYITCTGKKWYYTTGFGRIPSANFPFHLAISSLITLVLKVVCAL